jgi:uncharacterized protein YbgA (DUF1722 family)/uncharacterized protein YbbK (DUF523 family)
LTDSQVGNTTIIKIGVSMCLLGEKVRYDGGHKRDSYIVDILGKFFSYVPVCPEVEIGMGVPRESVRLEGEVESPRMRGTRTGKDWTASINEFVEKRTEQLKKYCLSGYILKKASPSCGLERVKVYGKSGMPSKMGRGLFGGALINKFPLLPAEDEGRLNDPALRDNFIVRVFAYHKLQKLFSGRFKKGELVKFHTVNKYLILAHSPKHYQVLGRIVASLKQFKPVEIKDKYSSIFMEALKTKSTVKKNVNVLYHIMGFLKNYLSQYEKTDLQNVIKDYHSGQVPLIVPLTLIKHHLYKNNIEYIKDQTYLNPHPKELMLRNHA